MKALNKCIHFFYFIKEKKDGKTINNKLWISSSAIQRLRVTLTVKGIRVLFITYTINLNHYNPNIHEFIYL